VTGRLPQVLSALLLVAGLTGCEATAPDSEPAQGSGALPQSARPRVVHVVDGDTLDVTGDRRVRLVGIDTPEVGECGYERATALLTRLTLGERVNLARSGEDRDKYGRLLRYVDVAGVDAGLVLLRRGVAVARYDSRDGYGFHPREPQYVRADRRSPDGGCR
jgi:endonuclease YncB( thermonuclease family)